MNTTILNPYVPSRSFQSAKASAFAPESASKGTGLLNVHPYFEHFSDALSKALFSDDGTLRKNNRNVPGIIETGGMRLVIKHYRKVGPAPRFLYRFLRDSKAKRSYDHALRLRKLGIATPQPVAWFEKQNATFLKESYYVALEQGSGYTLQEVFRNPGFAGNREEILRQFVRFTFQMHEKGVEFGDHTPGNTLIRESDDGNYAFSLADVSRIHFPKAMWIERRMQNFDRITLNAELLGIIANEYAKLSGEPEGMLLDLLKNYAHSRQSAQIRKEQLRKTLRRLGVQV